MLLAVDFAGDALVSVFFGETTILAVVDSFLFGEIGFELLEVDLAVKVFDLLLEL